MCYEGECHHKSRPLKAPSKNFTKELIVNEPEKLKDAKINHALYFKTVGKKACYYLRKKDDHFLFYSAREDMPFTSFNLAQELFLSDANHLIKRFYPDCETVTLKDIEKELKARQKEARQVKFSF